MMCISSVFRSEMLTACLSVVPKIISNVPADSLVRTERPPNKEILRYFIRHNALRAGTCENAPWVVEDELVKKYSLPSKFSDFLLDPHKVRLHPGMSFAFSAVPPFKPSGQSPQGARFGAPSLKSAQRLVEWAVPLLLMDLWEVAQPKHSSALKI